MAYRVSRLFVSNLPWTVGQREFYEYFVQFGPVVSHNVVFDKTTGLSKRFGFIQFGNESAMREVFKQNTHHLDGNIIQIQESTADSRARTETEDNENRRRSRTTATTFSHNS